MNIIFISGPSGSGKSTLSKQLLVKIKNGIILSTDNYYKTGLLSRVLSKIDHGYFDRRISFNYKLFKKDFNFILKNGLSNQERSYNFKKKSIKTYLKEIKNIQYLIVEGIFAKEFLSTIYNQNIFLLELKTSKNECMNRVIQRDFKERGKEKIKAKIDFLRSWSIYANKSKNKSKKQNKKELIITKNTNIDHLIKKYLI